MNLFSTAGYIGFLPEYPASVPPSFPALHENRDPAGDNCCSLQSPTTTACLPVNTTSHIHPSQAGKLHHSTTTASQPRASLDTGVCTDMPVCLHTHRQTHRLALLMVRRMFGLLPMHTEIQTHEGAGALGYSCDKCTNVCTCV